MRIAILANHLNPGGITSYVLDVCNGLSQRGYDITIFSSTHNEETEVKQEILPIRGKNAFSFHNLKLVKVLSDLVKRCDIKILWANTRITSVLSSIVANRLGINYLVTLHGFYRPNLGRFLLPCQGDLTIAISEAVKSFAVKRLRMDPSRIRVVYNAVSEKKINTIRSKIAQVSPIARDRVGLPSNAFVLGFRSRLSPVKGYDLAIDVMKDLPDYVYLLISTCGENEREYKRLADLIKSSMARRRILWYHNNLPDFLFWAVTELFLMPSYQEGFGLAALEALMFDIPVIASNVGGLPEVIENEKNGFIFNVGDPKDLHAKIMNLLNRKGMLEKMKMNIPESVKAFSYSRFLDNIEVILKELIQG